MATTGEALIEIERKFWTGEADFFAQHMDESCLLALRQLSGVRKREDIAAVLGASKIAWREVRLAPRGFVEPVPGMALLTYRASAVTAAGRPFESLATSGYAERDGVWKMVFHQQSRIDQQQA
ncbi:MAG: hypothetical protein AB7P02_20565 [Alphaproteobacteria bacterium]